VAHCAAIRVQKLSMELEPEPEPADPERAPECFPSDSDIAELVQRRRTARLDGNFRAADSIRVGLAVLGVYLVDTTVEDNKSRVTETRHAAPVDGISWIRALSTTDGCKFWRHKSRSFCGKPVCRPPSSAHSADVWADLQHAHLPSTSDPTASSRVDGLHVDISRLHYCASCSACHAFAHRCPCPFDPRHSILLTKLSGHLRLCQSKPGVSAAVAAGESGAAVPRGGAANAAEGGVNSLCDMNAVEYHGTALLPADADPDTVTAATNDLALLTALAERMASAVSALPRCEVNTIPPPVRSDLLNISPAERKSNHVYAPGHWRYKSSIV
jgi:hypothetical protein